MTVSAPKKFPLIPVIVGVGAIALIVTVILTMNTESVSEAGEYGTPAVTGNALAPATNGTDLALGSPIPEDDGADFSGYEVRIRRDGRPKIILFLAHWCSHCQAEVPVVREWIAAGNLPEGVDFIAVATSTNSTQPNFPPSEWLREADWNVPTIVDDAQYAVGQAYGLDAFPFWVFVSPDGLVVGRTSGELPPETILEVATTLDAMAPAG